jgi:hypothetical protein
MRPPTPTLESVLELPVLRPSIRTRLKHAYQSRFSTDQTHRVHFVYLVPSDRIGRTRSKNSEISAAAGFTQHSMTGLSTSTLHQLQIKQQAAL